MIPPAPPLLAFTNPALLWTGLGLVSVPILIHYFFRRRHRVVRWAAMDFLLAALKKQKRRMELENLLLLLLRCAAVLLLALGLARPGCTTPSLPFGEGARAVVLAIDTSASMGAVHTGRTALDRAKERAAQFLAELPEGSKVTLVASRDDSVGRGGPRALLENAERGDARAALTGVRPGYGPNDLRALFKLALEQVKALKGRQLVVFVTDLQRRDWFNDADARRDDLHELLRNRGGEPVSVALVDAGQEETANVVVKSLTVDAGRQAFAGKLLGVTATLLNYGPAPAQGTLTLQIAPSGDGPWEKVLAEEVIVPPPGLGQPEPLPREFLPRVPSKGDESVRFRAIFTARADTTDRDRLAADSERLLALRVRPPVRILPVSSYSGSLDLLQDVELTEVIEFLQPIFPADLQARDLSGTDIVLWADPETAVLGPEDAEKLKTFVRRGGGLLAYIARRGDPLRVLFEGDDPLLPMRVGDVRRDEEHPVLIDREDEGTQRHPLFEETRQPLFFSPEVTGYAQVTPFDEGFVVARYTNGDPAVLERRYGNGRVVAVTTTPDERFFRLNGSLLPAILFFNASQYLVWEPPTRRNVEVGDPAEIVLPPGTREVDVMPPAAAGGPSREPVAEGVTTFQLEDTSTPGFYRVVARGLLGGAGIPTEGATDIAVNLDAREGDLRRVTPVELSQAYPGTPLHFTGDREAILPRSTEGDRGEASRAFLGGVVFLLLVELLCAWRFGTRRRATA